MVRQLQELAKELGVNDGGLLKLGREISHDGALLSIAHMRKMDQIILRDFLTRALQHRPERVLVA